MQGIIEYQEIDAKLRKLEGELRSSTNRKNAGEMQQYLKDGQAKLVKLETLAKTITEQYNQATALYNEFINKLETILFWSAPIWASRFSAVAESFDKVAPSDSAFEASDFSTSFTRVSSLFINSL